MNNYLKAIQAEASAGAKTPYKKSITNKNVIEFMVRELIVFTEGKNTVSVDDLWSWLETTMAKGNPNFVKSLYIKTVQSILKEFEVLDTVDKALDEVDAS